MKMMFQVFAKQLFGAKYERLPRAFLVYVIVFWGLYLSGLRVRIAPFILYFMVSSYTAGVMWQALFYKDSGAFDDCICSIRMETYRGFRESALRVQCHSYECGRLFYEKISGGGALVGRGSGCGNSVFME